MLVPLQVVLELLPVAVAAAVSVVLVLVLVLLVVLVLVEVEVVVAVVVLVAVVVVVGSLVSVAISTFFLEFTVTVLLALDVLDLLASATSIACASY
jgi:hypothetical protein